MIFPFYHISLIFSQQAASEEQWAKGNWRWKTSVFSLVWNHLIMEKMWRNFFIRNGILRYPKRCNIVSDHLSLLSRINWFLVLRHLVRFLSDGTIYNVWRMKSFSTINFHVAYSFQINDRRHKTRFSTMTMFQIAIFFDLMVLLLTWNVFESYWYFFSPHRL